MGVDQRRAYQHTLIVIAGCFGLSFISQALAGPTAWVSNEKDNTVTVVDIDSLEVIETIEVGQRPRGIIFSKDYSKLYICASDDDTVQVMDVETRKILHNLPSGEDPELFDLHPNDRFFVHCE